MKKMKPAEREAHVKEMLARRHAIQKQIAELSVKREAFIKEQQKKNPSKADKAFDEAIRGALRDQAGGRESRSRISKLPVRRTSSRPHKR